MRFAHINFIPSPLRGEGKKLFLPSIIFGRGRIGERCGITVRLRRRGLLLARLLPVLEKPLPEGVLKIIRRFKTVYLSERLVYAAPGLFFTRDVVYSRHKREKFFKFKLI